MRRRKQREDLVPELTPMIDVIFLLLIFFMVATVFKKDEAVLLLQLPKAKDATVSKSSKQKEILMVNGKRRLYYPISNEGTHYAVQGPTRIEFISRYPVIKNHKKSHPFKYLIVIDGEDTVSVRHRYKVQRSISSIQHPKHRYTYSGNYFINLEKGSHTIELLTDDNQKYPVLMRVLAKEFESMGKDKKVLKQWSIRTSLV